MLQQGSLAFIVLTHLGQTTNHFLENAAHYKIVSVYARFKDSKYDATDQ